jgi:hypothetical protein
MLALKESGATRLRSLPSQTLGDPHLRFINRSGRDLDTSCIEPELLRLDKADAVLDSVGLTLVRVTLELQA